MLTTLLYSLFALDQTLSNLAGQYGAWIYALLFVVIFAETGLVVFPFLPATRFCSSPAPWSRRPASTCTCWLGF